MLSAYNIPMQLLFNTNAYLLSLNKSKSKCQRRKFSKEEDIHLIELVNKFGECDWTSIASNMKNRTARQCRERYRSYLAPSVSNDPWTDEENLLLKDKYKEFGPKWAKIATFFKARSDVNVKNHWNAMTNKEKKIMSTKKEITTKGIEKELAKAVEMRMKCSYPMFVPIYIDKQNNNRNNECPSPPFVLPQINNAKKEESQSSSPVGEAYQDETEYQSNDLDDMDFVFENDYELCEY